MGGVALLAEGVDRNLFYVRRREKSGVALLAEGVDRNIIIRMAPPVGIKSPSSRRAWIEMYLPGTKLTLDDRRPPRGGRG